MPTSDNPPADSRCPESRPAPRGPPRRWKAGSDGHFGVILSTSDPIPGGYRSPTPGSPARACRPASAGRARAQSSPRAGPAAHAHLSAARAQRAPGVPAPRGALPVRRRGGRCECVCVRARRWRRRGRQREQSGERRSSLKRAAMADRSPQVAAGPRPRREGAPSGARAGGRTPAPRERVGVGEGAGTRCPGLGPAPPAAAAPRPPARGEQREGLWGRAQWAWGAKG